mmetsp:Transcript_10988/g.36450  ORF Transcript_10988/g.36450 Transcript_10988/m.36450 type:complete len:203 (-) Transcript_10988:475-1083(-)
MDGAGSGRPAGRPPGAASRRRARPGALRRSRWQDVPPGRADVRLWTAAGARRSVKGRPGGLLGGPDGAHVRHGYWGRRDPETRTARTPAPAFDRCGRCRAVCAASGGSGRRVAAGRVSAQPSRFGTGGCGGVRRAVLGPGHAASQPGAPGLGGGSSRRAVRAAGGAPGRRRLLRQAGWLADLLHLLAPAGGGRGRCGRLLGA